MTIGTGKLASGIIAGQYGEIEPQRDVAQYNQDVIFQEVEPARQLIQLEQDVGVIEPARELIKFRQTVRRAGVAASAQVPAAYVTIGGVDYTATTALDTVSVSHGEDQASTASVFLLRPINEQINIPSFYGKTLQISTHSDPRNINSPIIILFTGWVETARHDRARKGILISGSDLRDERLGDEDQQEFQQLTGGLYSSVTQREDATGSEYVSELMKTVAGSIGYGREGDLRYHEWSTAGTSTRYTDCDIAYEDVETEFQARSNVFNRIGITIEYRYQLLRTLTTTLNAYKMRMFSIVNTIGNRSFDPRAFSRTDVLTRIESFSPWELISYSFYPLERYTSFVSGGSTRYVIDVLWSDFGRSTYCQGVLASLSRRVAQSLRESYSLSVECPQSVDAYGKTIDGSSLRYSVTVEYDRAFWEEDYKQAQKLDEAESYSAEQARADNQRELLGNVFDCAYAIAKKELVAAHRKNYVSFSRSNTIAASNIGDVIELKTSLIDTVGQVSSLDYTVSGSLRQTDYRIAVSYLDTDQPAPTENYSRPVAPVRPVAEAELESTAEYSSEDRSFNIQIAEISEQYTDELVQEVNPGAYNVPLENNNIILINRR